MAGTKASAIGRRPWAVAEGYIPKWSNGPEPEMESHETLCILNAGNRPARVELNPFFTYRKPAGPYRVEVSSRRPLHLRMNSLKDPESVARGKDYSCTLYSDEPRVVQHTRLY